MIQFFQKNKLALFLVLLISALFLLLRVPNLTLQPIFADEAIYIRWAQVMKAEPTLRFLPLSDGKTPLFMWLMTPLFKVFADPLFAGRFLSVLSGLVTLLGVLFIGWKFFSRSVGLWAAFLVAIVPFMVFFDRMALVDSMLTAFSVWSLALALLITRYPRLDLAMFLGYSLGGGLLTKPPGFFNLLALPVTAIALSWQDKKRQEKLLRLFGLWVVAVIIAMVMYNLLRLGPGFDSLNSRNQDYVFSPLAILERPLDPFLPHLGDLGDWFPKFLTWPVLILGLTGSVVALVKRNKYALVILLWGLVPLVIQMAFLKTFTARYVLFFIPPLLLLAAWVLSLLQSKIKLPQVFLVSLALIVLTPLSLNFNWRLLTDPASAPLPQGERGGYFEAWTAGYGFPEIAHYLIDKSKSGVVVVGTEGSFGTLPDGLQIYLDKHSHTAPANQQVIVIGGTATISAQIKEAALGHPTYFVANKSRFLEFTGGVELIKNYPKAYSNRPQDAILFFRVQPDRQ